MTVIPPSAATARRAGLLVFAFSLSLYVATSGGSMATDTMSYEVAKNIVEHGSVAMSYNVHDMEAHCGVDGRYYSPYGIGHPIYGIPFYLVGRTIEQWSGFSTAKPEIFRKAAFVLGSAIAAALTVWIAFWFALRVGGDVKDATYSALTLGFATLLWPYAKFGFNAPLATLCGLAGTYATWAGVRSGRSGMQWLGGAGFAGALFVKHELVLVAVPLAVWVAFGSRDRPLVIKGLLRLGLPIAIAAVVTLIYNDVRFENPLDTGYLRDQTVIPGSIWIGIPGLLVSPGRSLFLYSPIALVGLGALARLWRSDRATALLFAGILGILLLFYGSLGFWDADRSYGPRYLVPVLPYLCISLSLWFHRSPQRGVRRAVMAVAVFSAVVQVPGVLLDFSKAGYAVDVGPRTWEQRRWEWQSSGLVLNAKAALEAIPANVRYLSGVEQPPPVRPADARSPGFSDQFAYSVDFWWVYLVYMRALPAWAAVGLGAIPFGFAALFLALLRRSVRGLA